MKSTYPVAMKAVLVFEGGKVDDPQDPGGRTNQGVIQRVYSGYRKRKGLPPRDVYLMDDNERDDIYRVQYADAIRFDALPAGVDMFVFDGAVNSGPKQAIKWLQRALGVAKVDGVIGQATLSAVEEYPNYDALIESMARYRLSFLKALKTWARFGKGWKRRVDQLTLASQQLATGAEGHSPVEYVAFMNQKAEIEDAKVAPTKALGDATASGGIVTVGISQLQSQLTPFTDVVPQVAHLVAYLGIAGVIAAAAGGAYSWYARKRAAELSDALMTTVAA